MTSVRRQQIASSLKEKEYRDAFVDAHIGRGIAFQIRAMQEARGWTQRELGERLGTVQAAVSKLEDPDYGKYTLSTLKRLAAAFDVALVVRFAPFSELVDRVARLSPDDLYVPAFDEDNGLKRINEELPPEGLPTNEVGRPAQQAEPHNVNSRPI